MDSTNFTDFFLNQLNSGVKMDDLANDLAASLNSAADIYKRQQKEKNWKTEAANDLADHVNDFIADFYPEYGNEKLTGAQIIEFLDSLKEVFNAFLKLQDLCDKE